MQYRNGAFPVVHASVLAMFPRRMTAALPAVLLLNIVLLVSAAGPFGGVRTRASAPKIVSKGYVPKGARSNLWMRPKTAAPKCVGDTAQCSAGVAPAVVTSKLAFGCPDADQCSFLERFNKRSKRWLAANGYANGGPFNSWWSSGKATINLKKKKAMLGLSRHVAFGKPYKSGQLQTQKWYGYGCYEVRMKPVKQEGLISTFFTYTGQWDHAPGRSGAHNEVDIEFVWKQKAGKVLMQTNYFTNGQGGNEHYIDLGFSPEKAPHNYAFRWTRSKIEWFVDGKKVHTASKNTPKAEVSPHKIMMNFWPVAPVAARWGGKYLFKGPRSVVYEAVRFTKGPKCKIVNRF